MQASGLDGKNAKRKFEAQDKPKTPTKQLSLSDVMEKLTEARALRQSIELYNTLQQKMEEQKRDFHWTFIYTDNVTNSDHMIHRKGVHESIMNIVKLQGNNKVRQLIPLGGTMMTLQNLIDLAKEVNKTFIPLDGSMNCMRFCADMLDDIKLRSPKDIFTPCLGYLYIGMVNNRTIACTGKKYEPPLSPIHDSDLAEADLLESMGSSHVRTDHYETVADSFLNM